MKKPLKIALVVVGSVVGLFVLCQVALFALGFLLFGSGDPFPEAGESTISWRTHLPASATEIKESSWADGFLPDYDYYLRAKITEQEFDTFVGDLGLTPHTSDRIYSEESALSWSGHLLEDGSWWSPSSDLSGTFVEEGGTQWTYAKYENGYLYFRSFDH